jgi:hypothetical protein
MVQINLYIRDRTTEVTFAYVLLCILPDLVY